MLLLLDSFRGEELLVKTYFTGKKNPVGIDVYVEKNVAGAEAVLSLPPGELREIANAVMVELDIFFAAALKREDEENELAGNGKGEYSGLKLYQGEVERYQRVSHMDNVALARLADEFMDPKAREHLVCTWLWWGMKVAKYYHTWSQFPFLDIVQAASVGLLRAADKWRAEKGTTFTSFAAYKVTEEIVWLFRDNGEADVAVVIPRDVKEAKEKIRWILDHWKPDSYPSLEQLMELTGYKKNLVLDALRPPSVSENAPEKDDGEEATLSLFDLFPDDSWTPDQRVLVALEAESALSVLKETLNAWSANSKMKGIVRAWLWQNETDEKVTLESLGRAFGCTESRVSQIVASFLDYLIATDRDVAEDIMPDYFLAKERAERRKEPFHYPHHRNREAAQMVSTMALVVEEFYEDREGRR